MKKSTESKAQKHNNKESKGEEEARKDAIYCPDTSLDSWTTRPDEGSVLFSCSFLFLFGKVGSFPGPKIVRLN